MCWNNEKNKTSRLLSTSDALKITSKIKNKYIKTVNRGTQFETYFTLQASSVVRYD
jgi:hypothetical protein